MGSYLVTMTLEGHERVRYPVFIEREHHWSGVPAGSDEPVSIHLPPIGDLGPEDRYVPAGWFWSGGDPAANNSLAAQRLWLDGYVMRRFPVTIGEFVEFLNDLAAQGRLDEARGHAPQPPAWEQAQNRHEHGVVFSDEGRFVFPGPAEHLRWPVVFVNWWGAAAYAAWLAHKEGLPWRLVAEMEHEKAARGVDASPFPWGRHFDATFCKMRHSTAGEGRNMRAAVDAFEVDDSVYGIRGLAGNVHSWCIDPYQPRGPRLVNQVPQISDGSDVKGPGAGGVHRIVRGGSWRDPEANLRGAYRDSPPATYRDTAIGFRVCRPYPLVP
jgi:serine/threonine-protein kinase